MPPIKPAGARARLHGQRGDGALRVDDGRVVQAAGREDLPKRGLGLG